MPSQGESSQLPTGSWWRLARLGGLARSRLRVPTERLLPRFRLLVLAASLAYLGVAAAAAAAAVHQPLGPRAGALAAAALLGWWWVRGRDRGRFPPAALPLEVAALVVVVGAPGPGFDVSGLLFTALAFRAIHGSRGAAVATAAGYLLGAVAASLAAPHPSGVLRPSQLVPQVVNVVVTVVMARLSPRPWPPSTGSGRRRRRSRSTTSAWQRA